MCQYNDSFREESKKKHTEEKNVFFLPTICSVFFVGGKILLHA